MLPITARHTLTDKAKKNRLLRAKKLLCHLRADRLQNVLFTDEKIFTVEAAPNSQTTDNYSPLLTGTLISE